METRGAVQLAEDILTDHFGDVVGRVGVVLLERGPLAMSELIRFTSESKNFTDEPLKFPQLRNALLVMLQHCILSTRPHPQAQTVGLPLVPQIYTIHISQILCRCRFPRYLEVITWTHGKPGQVTQVAPQMLLTVLSHGRMQQSMAIATTKRKDDEITTKEAGDALKALVKDRLVVTVSPYVTADEEPSPSEGQNGTDKKEELTSPDVKRQKISSSEAASPLQVAIADPVLCLNRRALNLLLHKKLLERIVEHRAGQRAAQAMSILLMRVALPENGAPIKGEYFRWEEICEYWQKLFHDPGRNPERELDGLKQVLETLKKETKGAVRKRSVQLQGSRENVEEWTVEWPKARDLLHSVVRSQVLRDRFGEMGLRILNLLNEKDTPQKLEENEIFHVCMIPQTEGREMLNAMVKSHLINLQEVSRGAAGGTSHSATGVNMGMSYWLYYIDRAQVEGTLLQMALKAMLNLRIRFRVERMKSLALESRQSSLSQEEQNLLRHLQIREDALERSFLLLDAVLLGLECA